METKAKLSTKILSIFLSLLMAFSCAYAALPALAPKALGAEAEQAKWQKLADAFSAAASAGYMSNGKWTAVSPSGSTVTVTDETVNGYGYNVVAALGDILADILDEEGDLHNATLPDYLAATLAAKTSYSLNQHQKDFLKDLLPVGEETDPYAKWTADNHWNGLDQPAFADVTMSIVATRSQEAAVLTDVTDLSTVPAELETKVTVTLVAKFKDATPTEGNAYAGYYANASATVEKETAAPASGLAAHLTALSAYLAYVNSDKFQAGFNAYYATNVEGSFDELLTREKADLLDLVAEYKEAGLATNVEATSPSLELTYVENFLGVDLFNKQKYYVDQAADAAAIVDYRPFVLWIMNGEPFGEYNGQPTRNKLDYSPSDIASIDAVIAQAQVFKEVVEHADATTVAALQRVYGYETDAFAKFIAELEALKYNYFLQEIATANHTLLSKDHNSTYSFITKEAADYFKVPGSESVLGSKYVKTGDSRVNTTKTYYTLRVESEAYVQTADTEVKAGKTYYTKGVYKAVETPAAEALSTYFELVDGAYVATSDTEIDAGKAYFVFDADAYEKVETPYNDLLNTYYEYVVTYAYVRTADQVIVSGKTYYVPDADGYVAVEEPKAESLGLYYEVAADAVAAPKTSEIGTYYEKVETYYALKGIGDNDYLSSDYDYAFSKVDKEATPVPVSGTQYYTKGVYEQVASPVADDLGSYYVRNGNEYVKTTDTEIVAGHTYYTLNGDKYQAFNGASFAADTDYYTKDECPISDDDLQALISFYAAAVDKINEAEDAGVELDDYFTADEITAINDTLDALRAELENRDAVTAQFLNDYNDLYLKMVGYVVKGKSTAQLTADVGFNNEAGTFEKLYNTLVSGYGWFADDVRGKTARAFIDSIYVELFDRQAAAIQRIVDDYNNNPAVNGDKRNVRNLHQIRADAKQISDALITSLQANPSNARRAITAADRNYNKLNTGSVRTSDNAYTVAQLIDWANGATIDDVYTAVSNARTTVIDGTNNRTYITRDTFNSDFMRDPGNVAKHNFTTYTGATAPSVSGAKVSIDDTIAKLDTLLTGQSFVNLLGADERGRGIKNLKEYIELILVENLFTDKMVNTLVAALFPMLTDLFETTIANLINEKANPLDMGSLGIDNLSGSLNVAFNGGSLGGHGTVSFANMLNQLDVKIYPEYFGPYLQTARGSNYRSIGQDIAGSDKYWSKYRANGLERGEDGKFTSKVEFIGDHAFDWGIDSVTGSSVEQLATNRFNKFCEVLGDIFGAALPLMQALFGTKDLDDHASNFATAYGNPIKYKLGVNWSGKIYAYDISVHLRVNNLNLYQTLWIPLMEALGLNGDLMSYTFAALPQVFTGPQLVNALLAPVYALIKQVASAPLTSVTKLLPNLAFHLMNGSVNNLLNRHITFFVQGDTLTLDGDDVLGVIVQVIGNAFLKTTIANAIKVEESIALTDVLNLEEMLGIDLTDLNTLITGILGKIKEGADLHLPGIATGKLATMYRSMTKTKSSQACNVSYNSDNKRESFPARGNGQTYVYSNTGVVFYYVFDYLFRAAKQPGVLSDILGGVSDAFGADINLPDIVFALLGGITSAPQAFVALIEFLNMEKTDYDLAEYNWYQTTDATFTFGIGAPFAYVLYNNDWTKQKADYLYDNVDNLANAVINMIDDDLLAEYNGDANVWLENFINAMFNNEGIMNVIELTVKIGEALAKTPAVGKILKQQLTGENAADGEFDLFAWYNAYGYLYRENDEELDDLVNELKGRTTVNDDNLFLVFNKDTKMTQIFEAVPEQNPDGTDKTINLLNNTNGRNATCSFKSVRVVPMAPGETVALVKDGDLIRQATGSYSSYATPYTAGDYGAVFSNIRLADYRDEDNEVVETSANGDLLKQVEIRVTEANRDFMFDIHDANLAAHKADSTYFPVGTTWVALRDGTMGPDAASPKTTTAARNAFTAAFCELIRPLSIVFSFILGGKNLKFLTTVNPDTNQELASLQIKGYHSYNYALLPLLEAVGVHDLMTETEYNNLVATSGTEAAFNEIVKQLFDALSEILTDDRQYDAQGNVTSGKGAFQKVIDILPHLFYFLNSDGLTTVIKNLPAFVWQIVDTLRPIVNVNLDDLIHALACRALGFVYKAEGDKTHDTLTTTLLDLIGMDAPAYSSSKERDDAAKVEKIFGFSLKRMTLTSVFDIVEALTEMHLHPLIYALQGISYGYTDPDTGVTYGVVRLWHHQDNPYAETASWKRTSYHSWADRALLDTNNEKFKTYTVNFPGRDTITVTISALLDVLTYQQDIDGRSRYVNAEALDKLIGTVKERLPGAQKLLRDASAAGMIEAIAKVFEDKPFNGVIKRPNWDYIFENRTIPTKADSAYHGSTFQWTDIDSSAETAATSSGIYTEFTEKIAAADFHKLHYATMYNLHYATDWQPETAQATVATLENIADWVLTLIPMESLGFAPGTTFTSFGDFADSFLREKLFTADLLVQVLDLLAKVYVKLPTELLDVLNELVDIDTTAWADAGYVIYDYPYVQKTNAQGQRYWQQDKTQDKTWIANRAYGWFIPGNALYIDNLEDFLAAVKELLTPIANLLSIIFLSRDYRLFHSYDFGKNPTAQNPDNGTPYGENDQPIDQIVLNGVSAYAVGLVPILEALGMDLTDYKPEKYYDDTQTGAAAYKSADFVSDLIEILTKLVEKIEANPIEWLLNVLPNLIYFINANGLTASIENILGSLDSVIDILNDVLDLNFDLNDIMGSGLDLTNLTLEGIFGLIYKLTSDYTDEGELIPGLHLSDGLLQYIKNLYIGEIVSFESANGFTSFRMQYSSEEDKADMITVLLSLVLEYATDSGTFVDTDYHGNRVEFNNAETLDRLILGGKENEGLIGDIIDALRNPDSLVYKDVDWFYFDENYNLANDNPAIPDVDERGKVLNVKAWQFQYLNYRTKWTYDKALSTAVGLEDLIVDLYNSFLKAEDAPEISALGEIEILDIDKFFTAENVNKIMTLLQGALFDGGGIKISNITLNMTMINFVGSLLGADLMPWCHTYTFADDLGDAVTATDETGLTYAMLPGKIAEKDAEDNYVYTDEGNLSLIDGDIKTYLVNDRASFIKALALMLNPAQDLLSWLFFGDNYEFFTGNTDLTANDVLITIQGSKGYSEGLVLLLEALGCKGLKMEGAYAYEDNGRTRYHTDAFIDDVLTSVANRVEEILGDPVNEIVNLIPELIYFINAGGLQVSIQNLVAGPLALVNKLTSLMDAEQAENAGDSLSVIDGLLDGIIKGALENLAINGKTMADHKHTDVKVLDDQGNPVVDSQGRYVFELVHALPTFTLDGINLEYIFKVAEAITDLEITDVIGNGQNVKNFYMGDIFRYMSMGAKTAYKAAFSDEYDFADFITILLSFVLDVALLDEDGEPVNAGVIAGFLPEGKTQDIVNAVFDFLINTDQIAEAQIHDINWLYFDPENNIYNADGTRNDKVITPETRFVLPVRSINYLTYMSDWSEELAHYLYNNRNDLIAKILDMAVTDDSALIEGTDITITKLVNGEVRLADFGLFKKEYLDKILDAISGLLSGVDLPDAVYTLVNTILDVDLSAYANGTITVPATIETADDFIDGLTDVLAPLFPLLDWLLFGNDMTYFDKNTTEDGYEVLLNLPGFEAYKYGLVPLIEALGVQAPAAGPNDTSATVVPQLLKNIVTWADEVLAAPVDKLLELIPNLLYFINANGLAASVQNILAGPLAIVQKFLPLFMESNGTEEGTIEFKLNENDPEKAMVITINLNAMTVAVSSAKLNAAVDLNHLELDAVITILEAVLSTETSRFEIFNALSDADANGRTGLEKIKYFYFGQIDFGVSEANNLPRGKMVYTEDEDAADMLTIVVNFVVDLLFFGNNAKVIEEMIGKPGLITGIMSVLTELRNSASVGNYHWAYFNETSDQQYIDPQNLPIALPTTPFANYLTYPAGNRWTQNVASGLMNNLGELVDTIIQMTLGKDDPTYQTLSDVIHDKFDLYKAEYLNAIVKLIQDNLADYEEVIKLVGLVIGSDEAAISHWFEADAILTEDQIDNIENAADKRLAFATALNDILAPIFPLLDWLFFGRTLAYFVKAADGNLVQNARGENEIIRLAGSEGFKYGLVPLLTELGVELPALPADTELNCENYLKDVILAVLTRVDAILDNPVSEALDILPQLLYFVNANGISTMVQNLLGGLVGAVEKVLGLGLFELPEDFAGLADGVYAFVADKFGIDINNLDLEGLFGFLENFTTEKDGVESKLLFGLKLNEVFTRDFDRDGVEENILEKFYIGKPYTAAGAEDQRYAMPVTTGVGTVIYKLDTDENTKGDMITMLISIVLEVFFAEVNEDPIIDLINNNLLKDSETKLTKEGFQNLKALLMEGVQDAEYGEINWAYFLSSKDFLDRAVSGTLTAEDFAVYENVTRTTNYLAYEHTNGTSINLWREGFAQSLFSDLDGTINQVLALINKDDPKTLSDMIDEALANAFGSDNLFCDATGAKIVDAITGLFEQIPLDNEILDTILDVAGDLLGAENLSSLRTATFEMSTDESIPAATRFAEELGRVLAPISGVLAWLLFGENYKFFTQLEDGQKAMINLNGVEGYKYALAPILYALGVDTDITLTQKEDGTNDYAKALTDILVRLATRIDEILYQDRLIEEVLALLPNLIYFINADGLTVSLNNLLGSITPLLEAVGDLINKDLSIGGLLGGIELGEEGNKKSLSELGLVTDDGKLQANFNTVFAIVEFLTGIIMSDDEGEPVGGYLTKFYFGKLESGFSFDNLVNYRMVYTEEDAAYDLFTIVLELVLDVASYSGNAGAIQKLLAQLAFKDDPDANAKAATAYAAIMQLLYQEDYTKQFPMLPYMWAWTQYDVNGDGPEAGKILTPLNINGTGTSGLLDSSLYGPLYTKAMGEYMTKYLQLLIDTYITLLGIEDGKGGTYRSLDDILSNLVGTNIYKRSLLETIANAISGAINGLKDSLGAELFAKIVEILEEALDVDLTALLSASVPADFREGDQASFVKAISQMLSPAAPLLRWLLTSQDIALFSTRDRNDYIVIRGADGYQNAIVPILEALTGGKPEENPDILTQYEYEARTNRPDNATDAQKQAADTAMLEYVLNPILNRVNAILANPLTEIFNELPAVIYFINSKGLDTAFKNLLNPIFEILTVMEPLLKDVSFGEGKGLYKDGKPDLYGLIGVDLETLDMSKLVDLLIGLLNDSIDAGDLNLGELVSNSLGDLTLGVVKSFESKRMVPADSLNAKPGATEYDYAKDYTMAYAGSGDIADTGSKVDMVTIILKIALTFISQPGNVKIIENALKGKLNENGYKFLCALLENFSQFAGTPGGQDKIMYTLYYVFYTALTAGVATNNGLANFNYNYSFLNQLFATSDVGFFRQLEASLGDLLNKWTPDVVTDTEVVPNGFIRFFQSIIDFFKKIGNFFANLFRR